MPCCRQFCDLGIELNSSSQSQFTTTKSIEGRWLVLLAEIPAPLGNRMKQILRACMPMSPSFGSESASVPEGPVDNSPGWSAAQPWERAKPDLRAPEGSGETATQASKMDSCNCPTLAPRKAGLRRPAMARGGIAHCHGDDHAPGEEFHRTHRSQILLKVHRRKRMESGGAGHGAVRLIESLRISSAGR